MANATPTSSETKSSPKGSRIALSFLSDAHTSAENVDTTESRPDQNQESERRNHDDCRPPFGRPGTSARQNVSRLRFAVVHVSAPDHRNTFWAIATSL